MKQSYLLTFPARDSSHRPFIIRLLRDLTGLPQPEVAEAFNSGEMRIQVENDECTTNKLFEMLNHFVGVELTSGAGLRRWNIDHKGLPFKDPQGVFVDYRDYREVEQQLSKLREQLALLLT